MPISSCINSSAQILSVLGLVLLAPVSAVVAAAAASPSTVLEFPYRVCVNSKNFTWAAELRYQRDLGSMWGSTEVTIQMWATKGCKTPLELLEIGLPDRAGMCGCLRHKRVNTS